MVFHDRADAGKQLAQRLMQFAGTDTVVLGLARGGVPVAYEIAKALKKPLDVVVVRKLGLPWYPELGFGAIAPMQTIVLDEELVADEDLLPMQIDMVTEIEDRKLQERLQKYRNGNENLDITGKIAIIVDDGIATGITILAAITYVHKFAPEMVILAVPVSAPHASIQLSDKVDGLVTLITPANFQAVSTWYQHFPQITDEEVTNILHADIF